MLTGFRIKNFAIIESLTLPLGPGLNVLSGETGAGKSIIVGALGLLLGERANADVIRTGSDRASVEGVFDIADRPEVRTLLDDRGIDVEDATVVLKREVTAGRARAWINGTTVNAGILAEVGRSLVNLHGQHEAQTLLDPDAQRRVLDAFSGATEVASDVRKTHDDLSAITREIADLTARRAAAERRADYLKHVVREIGDANVEAGEDVRLDEEARRLENAEELRSLAAGIAAALDGDEDATLARLGAVAKALSSIQRIDPTLSRLQESYDAAYYAIESLARELETYGESVDLDPARLERVRVRRDLLFRLSKKYGGTLAEVIRTGEDAKAELDLVDSAGIDLRQLQARQEAARGALAKAAERLTAARTSGAKRLAKAVDAILPDLGMNDGHLTVALRPLHDIGATGAETVELLVALNTGHEARPLARVASGGELSRVMLALKTILARLDRVPTLVFDEVDAGIGGRVGLQVGDTMRGVAEHHQVFAISHLPQIAARAHHHILVSKSAGRETRGGVTTADVSTLAGDERVAEIARMLGGDPESAVSRAHARELLDSASVQRRGGELPSANGAGTPSARLDPETSSQPVRRSRKSSRGG